jgi:hypothetical protein
MLLSSKLPILSVTIILTLLFSCSTQENVPTVNTPSFNNTNSLIETTELTNTLINSKLIKFHSEIVNHFENMLKEGYELSPNQIDISGLKFDFNNPKLSNYNGTTNQCASVKGNMIGNTQYSLLMLFDKNLEHYDGLIVSIERISKDVQICNYYDVSGLLIISLKNEANNLSVYKKTNYLEKMEAYRSARQTPKEYISNVAKCIGEAGRQMSDGSILGSATAIGCMVFGAECAAAITVACGVSALTTQY